jgi:CRISPR-associated endoribonuclease Cas6
MRFSLSLQTKGRQNYIPVDYQYYIGASIYKVIGKADPEFAAFLHREGYTFGNKQFKFFCYSPLKLGKPVLLKEQSLFELTTNTIGLQVGFYMPGAAERFIVGLFNHQELYLGNRVSGVDMAVVQIERMPEPVISPTMHYRALSPVVASIQPEGEKYAQYLSPDNEGYASMLKNNLLQKILSIPGSEPLPNGFDFGLRVSNEPKSKLVAIKPGTRFQSKVRGYVYSFELTAPEALHRLVLSAGIGEKNSTGFGWVQGE